MLSQDKRYGGKNFWDVERRFTTVWMKLRIHSTIVEVMIIATAVLHCNCETNVENDDCTILHNHTEMSDHA